jgi:hypothetical protein
MENTIITQRWSDENGDLFRTGRKGSRYFTEKIVPAWEPSAGKVLRHYVPKSEAEQFDPDPAGELTYAKS